MKIKADQPLFDKWNALGIKISECGMSISRCSSIVQNDMVINDEQYQEWLDMIQALQADLIALKKGIPVLVKETTKHIKKCNGPTPKATVK